VILLAIAVTIAMLVIEWRMNKRNGWTEKPKIAYSEDAKPPEGDSEK